MQEQTWPAHCTGRGCQRLVDKVWQAYKQDPAGAREHVGARCGACIRRSGLEVWTDQEILEWLQKQQQEQKTQEQKQFEECVQMQLTNYHSRFMGMMCEQQMQHKQQQEMFTNQLRQQQETFENQLQFQKDAFAFQLDLLQQPKDGKDGTDGKNGLDGKDGKDGKDGDALLLL